METDVTTQLVQRSPAKAEETSYLSHNGYGLCLLYLFSLLALSLSLLSRFCSGPFPVFRSRMGWGSFIYILYNCGDGLSAKILFTKPSLIHSFRFAEGSLSDLAISITDPTIHNRPHDYRLPCLCCLAEISNLRCSPIVVCCLINSSM